MRPPHRDSPTDANLAPEPRRAPGHAGKLTTFARWPDVRRSADLSTLLWLLPLLIAAVYLVMFVVQLPHNIKELSWTSDYVLFIVPETVAHTGTGGNTVISSDNYWLPLLFGLLTAKLPLHRELWQILPTLLFFATALIVGWSVARVASRRAALLAVLLAVIASPLALTFFMVCAHNVLYPSAALAGAYLVWLALGDGRRRALALSVPLLAGVVLGMSAASDLLVVPAALAPLAFTAVISGLRSERRSRIVSLSVLTSVIVAVPVAIATNATMYSFGFKHIETPWRLAPISTLGERAELLFDGLQQLFNGFLDGPKGAGPLHYELGVASEVVMSAALLMLIVMGVRSAFKLLVSGWRKEGTEPTQLARSLHIVYWVVSAACAGGAYWLAGDTGGGTVLHESYYGTIIFSVAAVVPLALSAGAFARRLILVGASIFFAASVVGLSGDYVDVAISKWISGIAPTVTRLAAANDVNYGYGGYWSGSAITWNTPVTVRPLMECENPAGANICPFYDSTVPSWYIPQNRHTFLLIDQRETFLQHLPEGLGPPLKQYQFGTTTMYIYPYDIASRIGPLPRG